MLEPQLVTLTKCSNLALPNTKNTNCNAFVANINAPLGFDPLTE